MSASPLAATSRRGALRRRPPAPAAPGTRVHFQGSAIKHQPDGGLVQEGGCDVRHQQAQTCCGERLGSPVAPALGSYGASEVKTGGRRLTGSFAGSGRHGLVRWQPAGAATIRCTKRCIRVRGSCPRLHETYTRLILTH